MFPNDPSDIADATWADLEPCYRALEAEPLDRENVEPWLARWSGFEAILTEAISSAMIAYTCDTADSAKEEAHRRFSIEIAPKAEEHSIRLARRFADLGYSRPGLEQMVARFRRSIEIFREANVPLLAELEETSTRYQRITGGFLADWDGERKPLPQLAPFLQSPDRAVRERAFRSVTAPYLGAREELAALFARQAELRGRVAKTAGFGDYRDYAFAAKYRFDYGPDDCLGFHRAVEELVVPAVERIHAHRRRALGVDSLRPWDLAVSLYRDQPIRPFKDGAELAGKSLAMFRRLDPTLGTQFATLIDEGLLDLDSRANKAPGGYCDTLHHRGRPFIFMNASGVLEDVMTLLHEAGHAFHAFSAHAQPLLWQRHPTAEAAELASMSMELLAAPLLDSPGAFLSERDAAIARLEHAEDALITLCHVASIDAFQTWLYTDGAGADPVGRDRAWLEIRGRFDRGLDWSGLEAERVARWYRQLHVFLYPFYYIEYGIAQLGAVQVWLNHRRDPAGALAAYRRFLALGATVGLPELYREAGARLVFDRAAMQPLVEALEAEVVEQRAKLA
ncbi:MAG: M3 family oligoendopeptidase [Gemmatimonadales bacterium]